MTTARQLTKPIVPKLWGYEDILINGPNYCGKLLRVRPGYKSSLHYHKVKDETFAVLQGELQLEYGPSGGPYETVTLYGDEQRAIHMPPGVAHRFWASPHMKDITIVMEVSTPHSDDDVVRLEPSRRMGRVATGFSGNQGTEATDDDDVDAVDDRISNLEVVFLPDDPYENEPDDDD